MQYFEQLKLQQTALGQQPDGFDDRSIRDLTNAHILVQEAVLLYSKHCGEVGSEPSNLLSSNVRRMEQCRVAGQMRSSWDIVPRRSRAVWLFVPSRLHLLDGSRSFVRIMVLWPAKSISTTWCLWQCRAPLPFVGSVQHARRPHRGAADPGSDDETASESSGPPPPPQRPPPRVCGPPPPPPLEVAAPRPVAAAAPIPLVGVSEIVWPSQSVEGASTSFRDERQAEPLQEQGPSAPSAEQALAPPDLAQLFAAAAAQLSGASQSQAPFGAVCRCDGAWSGGGVSWAS